MGDFFANLGKKGAKTVGSLILKLIGIKVIIITTLIIIGVLILVTLFSWVLNILDAETLISGISIGLPNKTVMAASNNQSSGATTSEGTVFYQDDYAHVPYGDDTLAGSGCGPTCFAMVASDYLGREVTPEEAVAWCGNSYYVMGSGTSWAYFEAAAQHFGLPCTVQNLGSDINAAVSQLQQGNLVISSQRAGIFTGGGHFILLSSIDANGGIKVRDPNKSNAEGKGYKDRVFTADEIAASGVNYWAFVK